MEYKRKSIKGYCGIYEVDTNGNIFSLNRIATSGHRVNERILKGSLDKDGYLVVNLNKDNKPRQHKVHRVVLETFVENVYNKPQVNHIDNNKANNNIDNLEWVTPKENINHARKNGNMNFVGENHPCAILKDCEVKEIRRLYSEESLSIKKLSEAYKISYGAMWEIIRRKKWKHI